MLRPVGADDLFAVLVGRALTAAGASGEDDDPYGDGGNHDANHFSSERATLALLHFRSPPRRSSRFDATSPVRAQPLLPLVEIPAELARKSVPCRVGERHERPCCLRDDLARLGDDELTPHLHQAPVVAEELAVRTEKLSEWCRPKEAKLELGRLNPAIVEEGDAPDGLVEQRGGDASVEHAGPALMVLRGSELGPDLSAIVEELGTETVWVLCSADEAER